ncbi:uncharacterized protein METZ01_LOCUS167463 [marine metagenome]|uniref:Uncharacterized protein n=1 Tax=marine metagenome TaxID=408172 RepID=A0A382BLV0_9ZZZZ
MDFSGVGEYAAGYCQPHVVEHQTTEL